MDIHFFVKIARSFLGLVLLIFGINYFVGFLSIPIPPGDATVFLSNINNLGFFFPVLAILLIVIGALLVGNIFVSAALLLLFPLNLNILLFNIFFYPVNLPLSIAMFLAHLFLLWFYRKACFNFSIKK